MNLSTAHDPMLRDADVLGFELYRNEAERWHRAYQIVAMGLAVSVVVNIIIIFWRAL